MCCHFNVVYCSHFLLDVTCRNYGEKVFFNVVDIRFKLYLCPRAH